MRPWTRGTHLVLLASLLLAGCGGRKEAAKVPVRPEPSKERLETAKPAAEASNAVGLQLLEHVAQRSGNPNVLVSPISLQIASALLLEGTTGPEREEMKRALGLGGISDGDLGALVETLTDGLLSDPERPVHLANAVWLTKKVAVKKAFSDRVAKHYGAEFRSSPSPQAAIGPINAWVKEKTDGMIPSLMDTIDSTTIVVLLNAIAFNARWEHEFKPDSTTSAPFKTSEGTAQVPMMHGDFAGWESQEEEFAGVRMDYLGGKFSMMAFLPPEGKSPRDVLATLERQGFSKAAKSFYATQVTVQFPKFRWEEKHSLVDALQGLGVRGAFKHLDLSPINSDLAKGYFLGEVLQKTMIEVDERGTRAAVVTSMEVPASAEPMPLVFNRPFLYMVVHNRTGVILFLGICGDPTVES